MFSFLYRVFYDRTLFSSYIKKGKGYGLKPLLVLCVFAALCLSGRLSLFFSSVSQKPVDEFIAQIPQIVVEKGIIVFPEDKFYSYVPEGGRFFFVFDTTKNPVNLKDLPTTGVYLSSDALMTVRQNEIRRIPFVKLFEKADFTLDQNDIRTGMAEVASMSRFLLPAIMFVLCIPGLFFTYFVMMSSGIVLSFLLTHVIKVPLHWGERARLAALSFMPAGVVNAIAFLSGSNIRLGLFGFLITLIYMYCFLKDGCCIDKTPDVIER